MWTFLVLSLPMLVLAIAGLKQTVPPAVGILAISGFFACTLMALLFGLRARRITLEDRARTAAGTMLVLMAGMLNKEDDATLERIVERGGPAGDAAAMLLQKRKSGK